MGGLLDPNTILQLVISQQRDQNALAQRQMERQQALEERRRAEERQQAETLLLLGAREGADVKKLSGMVAPNALPPGFVAGVDELSKIARNRKKEEQAQGQIGPQFERAVQSQDAPVSREEVIAQLRGLSSTAQAAGFDPTEVQGQLSSALQNRAAQNRMIATEQTPEQIAARRAESRGEGRQIAAENRRIALAEQEQQVATVTSLLADDLIRQNPNLPSTITVDPNELERIEERLAASGMQPALVDRVIRKSQTMALDEARRRMDQARSATGTTEMNTLIEAEMQDLQERFPDATIRRNDVLLMTAGKRTLDPFSEELGMPVFAITQGKTDQGRFLETRRAQRGLLADLDALESSFEAMREDVSAGRVATAGRGIPEAVTRELENLGFGSSTVARYRQSRFRLVSTLLKATQGSRPSDFDLRMYLALLPFTSEVLSETAPAKIRGMREAMMLQIQSASDPAVAREIERRRGVAASPTWRRTERAFEDLRDPETGGLRAGVTDEDIDAALGAAAEWQRVEGSRFVLPGTAPADAAPLSAPARSWAEQNLGGP